MHSIAIYQYSGFYGVKVHSKVWIGLNVPELMGFITGHLLTIDKISCDVADGVAFFIRHICV